MFETARGNEPSVPSSEDRIVSNAAVDRSHRCSPAVDCMKARGCRVPKQALQGLKTSGAGEHMLTG